MLISFLALVVAYDYHPNAQTLYEAHLKPKVSTFHNDRLQVQSTTVPERTMWTYVVQIANAIKAVHDAGLAVRMIDATKVLLTGKNRYDQLSRGFLVAYLICNLNFHSFAGSALAHAESSTYLPTILVKISTSFSKTTSRCSGN